MAFHFRMPLEAQEVWAAGILRSIHSDMLILWLLFLWQRRNPTAVENEEDWSDLLRWLLFNLQIIWHEFVFDFQSISKTLQQNYFLVLQVYCLTVALLCGWLREKTHRITIWHVTKIKQVICHYYSTVTTGKTSVTVHVRNPVILTCISKPRHHKLTKNTKKEH